MKSLINLKKFIFFIILILFSSYSYAVNDEKKIISEIKSYIKNLKKLEADFIQVGPDGKVSEGKLYLDLPGKIRFEYIKPENLLITSQGFWLVVQDRKLKYTNNIPLNQTPLYFFLNKKLNFKKRGLKITLKKELGLILLTIKDHDQYHQSTLTMQFSENPVNLKKWIITDEFDNKTSVLLQNLNVMENLSNSLFFPDEFEEDKQ